MPGTSGGRPRKDGGVRQIGVYALAKELGMSAGTISRKLARGMTIDQVRADSAQRDAAIRAGGKVQGRVWGTAKEKLLPPGAAGPERPGTYVSKRVRASRMADLAKETVPSVPVPVAVEVPTPVPVSRILGTESVRASSAPVEESGETFNQAQLRKEIAIANGKELEYEQRRGQLVPIVHVQRWMGNIIIEARDRLLRLPAELKDRLAAEIDPVGCELLLRERIVEVLMKLKNIDANGTPVEETDTMAIGPMSQGDKEAACSV